MIWRLVKPAFIVIRIRFVRFSRQLWVKSSVLEIFRESVGPVGGVVVAAIWNLNREGGETTILTTVGCGELAHLKRGDNEIAGFVTCCERAYYD